MQRDPLRSVQDLQSPYRELILAVQERWTSTGMLLCVRTFTVSLPRTIADIPRRPCEAMTMRSQLLPSAVSMIAA